MNAARFGGVALLLELQLSLLVLFQQRNDDINTAQPPAAGLVFEPVSAPWARGHGQLPSPRAWYPK